MPSDPKMYAYGREVAEPQCVANIRWHHMQSGIASKTISFVEQTSEENDVKHGDIIEVVGKETTIHDVKSVTNDIRIATWLDENGNPNPERSNYSIPCKEMLDLREPKWKCMLDKNFFFEFEEYDPSDPTVPTKNFWKVPYASIAKLFDEQYEEGMTFILVPLEYVKEHAVFKYEDMNGDLDL